MDAIRAHAAHSADQVIAMLAARQHGLVTRGQLLEAGVGLETIKYRLGAKRLEAVQRGVYRIGPVVSPKAREMAAVLACGREAVLSHRSAATFWDLLPPPPRPAPVDVTVGVRGRRRRPGIRAHRASLVPAEVTKKAGIPITTPARTLLDLAAVVSARELETALARAERERLTSRSDLTAMIARFRGRAGIAALRALMRARAEPALTLSKAEERFLELIRRARLPGPQTNVVVAGHRVDFFWRAEGVVVEVDGYAFHSSLESFESDRHRDGQLSARGIHVLRVPWRQLVEKPEEVLVLVAQTLAVARERRAGRGGAI